MLKLDAKNVLITGASSGIGQAIAIRFAQEGANVAINYRSDAEQAEANRKIAEQSYRDIGKPERYDRVCREFENGTIARSSLTVPQRAVFLDRDGTLIPDKDCLRTAEGLELLPGVAEAIHELNHHAWRTVVVTNQPVIAKGWTTESEMQRMHYKLETLLGLEHAFLDRIYITPGISLASVPSVAKTKILLSPAT